MKMLELNLETLRCLDREESSPREGEERRAKMTHFYTNTCNHTTCEVC